MVAIENSSLVKHLQTVEGGRLSARRGHRLMDILCITVCAVICSTENWVDIERFGKCKIDWLKTFLGLPYEIPSHNTFGRVFASLNPPRT